VAEFESAYHVCRKAGAFELEPRAASIESALKLYTGDLLASWSQDWCQIVRDRLHEHYLVMLDALAEHYELAASYDDVYRFTERLLELDAAHERTHRRLMRVFLKIGDRTRALRQFDRCAEALKRELGVEPGPKTLAVLEHICERRSAHHRRPTHRAASMASEGLRS
jgi:DNA-binding SARP family transcriptional activator